MEKRLMQKIEPAKKRVKEHNIKGHRIGSKIGSKTGHKITLLIIRHGETEANIRRINQGQVGGKLTRKGIMQSKKAGRFLKDTKIDEFFISDLGRTMDTAEQITRYHPESKIRFTRELREQNLGILEGTRQGKEDALLAGLKKAIFRPKGGESLLDMYNRVNRFCKRIIESRIKEDKDMTIAFVTHGGPIVCMLLGFTGNNMRKIRSFLPPNTGITTINIYKKDIRIIRLNSTEHLD